MNFLNPEDKTRIKIRKIADQPVPPAAKAPAPGAAVPGKPGVAGVGAAAKPGLKPGLAPAGAKPGVPGAKPGPSPTSVAAVVKAKQPPRVQVLQVDPGVFEVHFTCSCGEQYVIRCDSAAESAEKSSAKPTP